MMPPRFIPAWAGNTRLTISMTGQTSVHPRVGGEHTWRSKHSTTFPGSSPRGRGTLVPVVYIFTLTRFIPAWAGNTSYQAASPCPHTVHPRVGGEHPEKFLILDLSAGSSPRGRGTPLGSAHIIPPSRFIPAWAGEHKSFRELGARVSGSSPRGRGTPFSIPAAWAFRRFIPAWAGNTRKGT